MKTLQNRISRLEERVPGPELTIERVIFDNREQVRHPERFTKVLVREDDKRKLYRLERKG